MKIRAEAYFDESGDEAMPGYFGVAGFAGPEHQWRLFDELWKMALEQTGAPYLHMREFAHSVEAFAGWRQDHTRREQLMAGVVTAILTSELSAVGSALRVDDFNSLTEAERQGCVSPYYCCLQDVLWGFALMTMDENPPVEMHITGDRNEEREDKAKKLHRALRGTGGFFANFSEELHYADMRQTFGLQAADLLAYEMVKELRNQDARPEDRMRWPLDQVLSDPESPQGKMLKYTTAEMLRTQANGQWQKQGHDVVTRNLDESLRILRDKSEAAKRRLRPTGNRD